MTKIEGVTDLQVEQQVLIHRCAKRHHDDLALPPSYERGGVLIKNAEALEAFEKVDTLVVGLRKPGRNSAIEGQCEREALIGGPGSPPQPPNPCSQPHHGDGLNEALMLPVP
jgi:hypothetical protein